MIWRLRLLLSWCKSMFNEEYYTQPFTGDERVQFSDTDERDSRFIRVDVDVLVSVEDMQ